ncbi:MAG: ABC transporter ATP-binding protein [bacterium]|nr:ABC transporter ATP-binding protein [bacterium]
MRYIKQILLKNKWYTLTYLFLGIAIAFFANYKATYFQSVIDGLANGTTTLLELLLYGGILLLSFLLGYAQEYPGKQLEHGIFLDFKLLSLQKISKIDYLNYQSLGTGELTQRIENGSEAGKNMIYNFWFRLIQELFPTILFSIFFIYKISTPITIALLAGYLVIFLITNILLKTLYQLKEKILVNEEKMNHFLVRGFMELTVFRLNRQFSSEYKKANGAKKEIVSSKVKMTMIHEAFFTIFAILVAIIDVAILLYAWNSKSLSIGSVVALIALVENAYTPIAIFNVVFVQYKLDKAAFQRFELFLTSKEDPQLDQGVKPAPIDGSITIKGLHFDYGNRCLFEHLDLSIAPGEKIALVGESGSGKSTLVKLMLGLLKYSEGSICYSNQELKDLCLNQLYTQISYISQEVPIFDGTLRENLVFDKPIADSKLITVLKNVELLPLLSSMPDGLNTAVGEKGMTLSGGERQRLALARVWLHQTPVVILDEVTSAMDSLTAELVMSRLLQQLQDHTVIAIAHQLQSIRAYDRILVFKRGEIIAQGTFDKLLATNDYFYELYSSNSKKG